MKSTTVPRLAFHCRQWPKKDWVEVFVKSAIHIGGIIAFVLITGWTSTGIASDLRNNARVAAEWAIERGNPEALADSINLYLDLGGGIEADDPFSVVPYLEALRAMEGGTEPATELLAVKSRGQLGGAPRTDVVHGHEKAFRQNWFGACLFCLLFRSNAPLHQ